jgi:hypothetical protein
MLKPILVVAAILALPALCRAQAAPQACAYDRAAMLVMDFDRFDRVFLARGPDSASFDDPLRGCSG